MAARLSLRGRLLWAVTKTAWATAGIGCLLNAIDGKHGWTL